MELINREEAIREISLLRLPDNDTNYCIKAHNDAIVRSQETISQIQTIESRPTGVWVGIDEEPHEEWECSNCGKIINADTQDELEEHEYCHKCGAKMSTPWADIRGEE